MKLAELCQVFTAVLFALVHPSDENESRPKRALFNTGKFLVPHFSAPKPIIPFVKYPVDSYENLLPIYGKTYRSPPRRHWNQLKRKRQPYDPPRRQWNQPKRKRQPYDSPMQPEIQMPGRITDAWADGTSSGSISSNDAGAYAMEDGQTGQVDQSIVRHSDCTKIPDGAAEELCEFAKEDAEMDKSEEFLWVPLTTPLVGYPINTRLERWYQKGCFNWKHKKCGGTPRYPLDSNCKFWTPEAVEKPGCPPILKTKKVSWKSFPPNHCPCKWPCTTMFASIQECYEMPSPNVTLPRPIAKQSPPTSLRLNSAQAFQLCRAVERGGGGPEPYETIGWIPIRLRMGKSTPQQNCFSYVYTPCFGGPKDTEDCGEWKREQATCDRSEVASRGAPSRGRTMMGTPNCPCELPCIRFFDLINKCHDLAPLGRKDGAEHTKPESLLMKDAPRDGTSASLIECNFYENEIFCTAISDGGGGNGLDESRQGISGDPTVHPPVGRVKCEMVDSRPTCRFVVD